MALAARLPALSAARETALGPDAAHFLNVARCVARGHGFSNPAAWPAWLEDRTLPAPETFKDPGLPYAIAALAPIAGGLLPAGVLISMLAGLALPLAVRALALRLTGDRWTATLAGLITAASPVLIVSSARVMSDSAFVCALTLAFLAAAPRSDAGGARAVPRALGRACAAGALLGAAFLVRTQALIAIPALAWLLARGAHGQRSAGGAARIGAALACFAAVVSPLVVRNLRHFGTPLHSDATAFFVWPYLDPIAFSHGLDRPPAFAAFAAAHPGMVAGLVARNLVHLVRGATARELIGQWAWLPPLAVGAALALARPRAWGFAWAYVVPCAVVMAAMSWATRYFASLVPFLALWAALGAAWLARRIGLERRPVALRAAVIAALALVLALAATRAWRDAAEPAPAELAAALAARHDPRLVLAPDEAVMAVTTSYWSWCLDRPSVHLPITDPARVAAIARSHRVRWATLPTSALGELAARYPGGRLPSLFVPAWSDTAHDLTVFAVRDSAAP
ncbi:MAG: hypothetical protein HYR74_05590 [Candidatus Eisenbacteria bacterium]|nr:hypothetical protein [Candidatus Eisenbacteria bacterium]